MNGKHLVITRTNKLPSSRQFDARTLFAVAKTNPDGDFRNAIDRLRPNATVLSNAIEDT